MGSMNLRGFGQFVICTGMMLGGSYAGVYGYKVTMWVLLFAGVVGIVWAVSDSLWEQHNDEIMHRTSLVRARTTFAATIAATDDETRHFLAKEWPEMGVEFGEESLVYILRDGVNTQVLLPFLRAFLLDSNEQSFVDVRKYNDDKYLQERMNVSREVVRKQWNFASRLLVDMDYLLEDSMAGNRTWRWVSKAHYLKLCRRYLNVQGLPELE